MNEKINGILSEWSSGRHIDENKKGNAVRFLFTLVDDLFELVDGLNKEVEELKNKNHVSSSLIEAEEIKEEAI